MKPYSKFILAIFIGLIKIKATIMPFPLYIGKKHFLCIAKEMFNN